MPQVEDPNDRLSNKKKCNHREASRHEEETKEIPRVEEPSSSKGNGEEASRHKEGQRKFQELKNFLVAKERGMKMLPRLSIQGGKMITTGCFHISDISL